VVLAGRVEQAVLRTADAQGLSVLEARSATRAFSDLIRLRPRVIVVQLPSLFEEELELIRLVSSSPLRAPIIAAAVAHDEAIERAVLAAGACFYVPCVETNMLNEALEASLGPGRPPCRRPGPNGRGAADLSGSPCPIPEALIDDTGSRASP